MVKKYMVKKILPLILMLLSFLILSGCGADKTVDDWKNQRVAEELARIESVKGTYEGQAYSVSSGELIGNVVLEIEPKIRTARSSDQLTSEIQADLFVRLILKGASDRILTFSTGSIIKDKNSDPERFTAVTVVGDEYTAAAEGRFINGQIQGTAKVQEFPENTIRFVVSRVSSDIQGQSQRITRPRAPDDETPLIKIEIYQANKGLKGELTETLRPKLIIIPREFDASVDLLSELLPIRRMSLTFSIDGNPILTFKDAQIDRVSGKIIAENIIDRTGTVFVQRIQCQKVSDEALFCSMVDNTRGLNFNLQFFRLAQ